ncbi:hypothetical protein niasHT_020271 [Heterodera trifolii]|uniref:Uncharacterized protein n=1 Tax=Heterodera trifolii TaxID=157864 RepID=A0ABD2JGE3_9BILA
MSPSKCAKVSEFFDLHCATIVDQLMPHIDSVRYHLAQFVMPNKASKSAAVSPSFHQMSKHKNSVVQNKSQIVARRNSIELVNALRGMPADDKLLMAFCCSLVESGCCLDLICTMLATQLVNPKKLEQFAKMNAIGVAMDTIGELTFESANEENDENGASTAKVAEEREMGQKKRRDFLQLYSETLKMIMEEADKVSLLLYRWDAISWQKWESVKNESQAAIKVEKVVTILLDDPSAFDHFCVALLLSQQFKLFNIFYECADLKHIKPNSFVLPMQFLLHNFVAALHQHNKQQQKQLAATNGSNNSAPNVCPAPPIDETEQIMAPFPPPVDTANLGDEMMFWEAPEGFLKDFNGTTDTERAAEAAQGEERMMGNRQRIMTTEELINEYKANRHKIYPNFANPRGLALVINNYRFMGEMQPREGTHTDGENIVKLLDQLKYKVLIRKDLTAKEMMWAIREFARQKEAHQKASSAIVVVLSHGEYDTLLGTDEQGVNVHQFAAQLNSQNCPYLMGKPKIFFIQACRGEFKDFGVLRALPIGTDCADGAVSSKAAASNNSKRGPLSMFSRNSSPRNSLAASIQIPLHLRNEGEYSANLTPKEIFQKDPTNADFLVVHSTTPHYVSWRHSANGAWFVQSLCKVFSEMAPKHCDIFEMLTTVNSEVSAHEGLNIERPKQIPEFTATLRKRLFFFVGVEKEIF